MALLPDYPTTVEARDFLLDVMDSADSRKAKINPSLTKEQVWNLHMGIVMKSENENEPFIKHRGAASIAVKNLNREFGSKEAV